MGSFRFDVVHFKQQSISAHKRPENLLNMAVSKLGALIAGAAVCQGATLQKIMFDTAKHPSALCNDGTNAGYYYKPSASKSSLVVVHLEGGGWCWDEKSCNARSANLVSSKGWGETKDVDGLFNASTPLLRDANLVYVPYCSSDGWIGHISAANAPAGLSYGFHGQSIVRAVLEDVSSSTGFGVTTPAQYLISGCSAGARGVLFNAESIASILTGLPSVTQFGLLLDSAFWVDVAPPNATVPFQDQARGVIKLMNVTGGLSTSCLAAYPGDQAWKCIYGQYAVPHISPDIPYLLHAFSYDEFQISGDLGISFGDVPKTSAQLAFAEAFRKVTTAAANVDVIAPARAGTAALLPACYHHCATESSLFTTLQTKGVSLVRWQAR